MTQGMRMILYKWIGAEDGYEERPKTKLFSDIFNAYKNAHYFDIEKDNIRSVAGSNILTCNPPRFYV